MVVRTTSNADGTCRIAVSFAYAHAARCSANTSPANAAVIFWSRLSVTSIAKWTRDHPGDLAHVVVDRVALGDAPGGARVADVPRVVERHDRFEARQPGCDHLRPAAEPGEEVRLDEARRDADVRVEPSPIEIDLHARGRRADARERRRVAAVVIDHRVAAEDFPSEHALELLGRVAAMRAGGDEDRDVLGPTCGSSAKIACSISIRGCARVMSHTEIATFCPARTRSRSGARSSGERIAWSNVACGSGTAALAIGSMTVTRSFGRSTSSPSVP